MTYPDGARSLRRPDRGEGARARRPRRLHSRARGRAAPGQDLARRALRRAEAAADPGAHPDPEARHPAAGRSDLGARRRRGDGLPPRPARAPARRDDRCRPARRRRSRRTRTASRSTTWFSTSRTGSARFGWSRFRRSDRASSPRSDPKAPKEIAIKTHDAAVGLLARMTLAEKIGQLNLLAGGRGARHRRRPARARLADAARRRRGRRRSSGRSRGPPPAPCRSARWPDRACGIPLFFAEDVIHGHRTVFPLPVALACSWDMALIEETAAFAAAEAASEGLHQVYAPMIDVARDPRWGRVAESPGEDPLLASRIAAAMTRGLPGRRPRRARPGGRLPQALRRLRRDAERARLRQREPGLGGPLRRLPAAVRGRGGGGRGERDGRRSTPSTRCRCTPTTR